MREGLNFDRKVTKEMSLIAVELNEAEIRMLKDAVDKLSNKKEILALDADIDLCEAIKNLK